MVVKTFYLQSLAPRLVALCAIPLCLVAVYFVAGWCFGNTIARQTTEQVLAETAVEMAPLDPQPYYALASIDEKSFLLENLPKAITAYEKAVSLSPNDFRLWLALGKARDRSGNAVGAEKALRKAVELAPNYAEGHWILGNQLLRQGNDEEAFVEIRQAAAQDKTYANPAVVTAWQVFGGDITQISQKIGDSVPIKAGLVPFLANQGRIDEAFTFWNSIPDDEKITTYKASGEGILGKLIEKKEFRKALELQNQLNKTGNERFTVGSIFNGDFERDVKTSNTNPFDWQIAAGQQPQIGVDDSQKHGGNKSLILLFNSSTGEGFRTIQQTVAIDGGKSYNLSMFYRSDLKKDNTTVQWEIVDASDGKVLAMTEAVANTSDWATLSIPFTAPAGTQAVTIRLARAVCKQSLCPISGRVWFDDIVLK